MRENAFSIIKQRRPVTLGGTIGTIDFHIQQCKRYHSSRNSRDSYKVCGWLATGIRKFLDTANYGSSRQNHTCTQCYSRPIESIACLSTFVNRAIFQLLRRRMRRHNQLHPVLSLVSNQLFIA